MFRPDRFDAAVAYAGYCGLDDRLVGRIEILDPAALSEVLFSEDYFIVRWAAIWLVWNDHVDNLIQAGPIDAHRCRLELREMLTSGADLTEANALARMEHLVRRIHEQLPEYYLTAPNAMTESTAPKHADLRPLDWRREHDAMFPADRPVTFGP
jgi:hypothetical protein